MEAAVLGAVLSATLPWIRDEAIKLVSKQVKGRRRRLRLDVEEIIGELKVIKADINDYGINLERTLIRDLRQLADEIEDCADNFRVYRKDKDLEDKIGQVKERIKKVRGDLHQGTNRDAVASSSCVHCLDAPDGTDKKMVVGMDVPRDELKQLLQRSEDKKLRVIFIVGFGGIGKTLLAKKVLNEEGSELLFPRRAHVCAAGKDPSKVLEEIQEKLNQQCKEDHTDVQHVGSSGIHGDANARSCLGTHRYLIVIEHVRSQELLSDVISKLLQQIDHKVDGRIIVTTTDMNVARTSFKSVHLHRHVYKMRPLDLGDSDRLFWDVAFGGERSPSRAHEKNSSVFREYCDGVPLGLVSIAQYCAGAKDLMKCEEAWRKLCNQEKDPSLEEMQRVLGDTYDSLPGLSLQYCLLYLCMFPRGHHIRRGPLIRRWHAEGLALREDGGGVVPSVDHALEHLKTLVDRNICWPIQMSIDNQVKTCKPPGMMLGYITNKSRTEDFLMLSCADHDVTTRNRESIRRLSLHGTSRDADSLRVLSDDNLPLPRLRTLAVFGGKDKKRTPLSLANRKLLRVLDLEAYPYIQRRHLDEISKLQLLKYLSLGASVDFVPREISGLKCLETLQVRKDRVVTVPVDILKLPNLKHLLGKLKFITTNIWTQELQDFLEAKSKLEKLAGFITDKEPGPFPPLMGYIGSLKKAKLWCSPEVTERNSNSLSQCIAAFLVKQIDTPTLKHSLSIDFDGCNDGSFLFSVQAVGCLYSLKLRGPLPKVPQFVTQLCGITKLCLSSQTLSWNAITNGVSKLEALQYLKLVAGSRIEDDVVIQTEHFVSLERLCLVAEHKVSKFLIEDGALKHLLSLHLLVPAIDAANQIQNLHSLEEVQFLDGMTAALETSWKQAASGHPKRPNLVFIGTALI